MSVTWYAIPAKKIFIRIHGSYCSNSLRSYTLFTFLPNQDRAWNFLVINLQHPSFQAFISRIIHIFRLPAKQVFQGRLESARPASTLKHLNLFKVSVPAEIVETAAPCSSQNQLLYDGDIISKGGAL